jgi:hypothetical protein
MARDWPPPRDPVLWGITVILCLVTALAGAEIAWLFLAAGAFGAIYYGGGLPRRTLADRLPARECLVRHQRLPAAEEFVAAAVRVMGTVGNPVQEAQGRLR